MKKRILLSVSIVVVLGIGFLSRRFFILKEPVGCCQSPSCHSSDPLHPVVCPDVCYPCSYKTRFEMLLDRILNKE